MKRWIWVALVLLLPSRAVAQPPISYTLTIYAATTNTVIGTPTVIPVLSFVCGQAMPTGVTVNPNKVVFVDPQNAGQACIYTDPGNGPLASLPFGTASYEATVIVTNSAGPSQESLRALPFTHPGAPLPAPTGVKVIR